MIDTFRGDYDFCSNFYEQLHPIYSGNLMFRTNEHYYHAHKTLNMGDRLWIASLEKPWQAKKAGSPAGYQDRKIELRPDWKVVDKKIMFSGLYLKFIANHDLALRLMNTHPKKLVEGNTWHDNYWGDCQCKDCQNIVGLNNLGILLMQLRDLLIDLQP
jgi:hypothetical protein